MDDNTVDALREILLDMTNTIELLSTGARSGQALIAFLEEVLKTIEAWANKYNVTLDGKTNPEIAEEYPDSDSESSCSDPSPSPAAAMADPSQQHHHHHHHHNQIAHSYAPPGNYHFPELQSVHHASQMMDQLELALDLDQDVHVNVNELMDLAHPRIHSAQSSNGDTQTMAPSNEQGRMGFSWNEKLAEQRQCLSQMGHDLYRNDDQSGELSHMQMNGILNADGRNPQGQYIGALHLENNDVHGNSHVSGGPMNMGIVSSDENNLKLISPNHSSKCLKLDIGAQYSNQMMPSQAYPESSDLMKSSEWLEKANGNQHYR